MWTKNKKGFTLAELLIVVAIIGVLVAISIPIFSSCMERRPTARFAELNGRDAERAATLAYDRFELFPS